MALAYKRDTAPASFSTPFLEWEFTAKSITVINEDTTNAVEVSLDGVSVHARLVNSSPALASVTFKQPLKKLWVRLVAGTPAVQARAED